MQKIQVARKEFWKLDRVLRAELSMASMIRKFKIELVLVINFVTLGALAPFLHIVNKSLRHTVAIVILSFALTFNILHVHNNMAQQPHVYWN